MKKKTTIDILGEKCLSPEAMAESVGVHRNTILNWVKLARKQGHGMPYYQASSKSRVWIPVERFTEWYKYSGQN